MIGDNVQYEKAKNEFEIQRMEIAASQELQKLQKQFEYDMQLKKQDVAAMQEKENRIEDRKDNRTKMQATQQSQMIAQRKDDTPALDFESDTLESQFASGGVA